MWSAFSPRPPTPTARRCCLRCQTWTASANLRASRCTANCRRRWRPRAAAVFVPAARVRKHAARPRRRCCARSRPAAALRATFRTSLHHEPEPGCIADPAAQRRGHFARQPEPPPAGRLWRHPVPDPPNPPLFPHHRPLLRQRPALCPALGRLAAVHAGAPRYLVRCAGLPLAPLGLDRSLGGRDHLLAAQRRRRHPTDLGPSAPVRERRRKLPRRLSGLGLSARPRKRPVENGAKRVRHWRPAAPGAARPLPARVRHQSHLVQARRRLSRPADHGQRRALDRRERRTASAFLPDDRRVRSARTLRHATPLGPRPPPPPPPPTPGAPRARAGPGGR